MTASAKPLDFSLAHRLREARLRAHMDQPTLARAIGVSHATVSAAENGRQEVSAVKFIRWARVCDVPLEWLAEELDK